MIEFISKQDKLSASYVVKHSFLQKSELSGRTIQAVANTYNFFDSDADVLRLGSAAKSINERGPGTPAPQKILHLKQHNMIEPVGLITDLAETTLDGNTVLYFESKLSESSAGEELKVMYEEGIYNQHSIGFKYINLDYIDSKSPQWEDFLSSIINPDDAIKEGFAWDVKEIKLYEISTVSFGANALTPYLGMKTANKWMLLENTYAKLDQLMRLAMHGKHKSIATFDLQVAQLKQMIKELTTYEPDAKACQSTQLRKRDSRKDLLLTLI